MSTAVRRSSRISQRNKAKELSIPSKDVSSASSLKSDVDESDVPSLSSVSDDNSIETKPTERESTPSIHEFLSAHSIFGDYIRKHEIPRKVFHSSIGFITLYLYTIGVQIESFPVGFHIAFINIFILDLIRFRFAGFNKLYCQVVGALMRESEVNSYNGVLWYILGLDFSFSFFSKDIILLSVLLLSWSDTAASTCGRKFGHLTPKLARNKSLAGSMAAFAIGVLASYLLYGYFIPNYNQFNREGDIYWTPETSYLSIHTMSILSGFVAALSEGIDLFNWDDNFTIPVLSSIFFYGVITLFHK